MPFSSKIAEQIMSTETVVEDGRQVNPAMTQAAVNELLREMARWLVDNPEEHIDFANSNFLMSPDPTMQKRMTHAYIRNTMGRVPEVREAGRVKVSSVTTEQGNGYRLSFTPGEFAKNRVRDKQIEKARADASRKALQWLHSMIERFNPDLSFLASAELTPLQAALNVQAQYKTLLDDIRQRYEDGTL